jgi:hypothetical protein
VYIPFLMCLGTGIAVNNTKAILEALLGFQSGFVRTPKFGIEGRGETWKEKRYHIPFGAVSVLELILGLYSLTGLIHFVLVGKFFIGPFMLLYTVGFFYVFLLSVRHGSGHAKRG